MTESNYTTKDATDIDAKAITPENVRPLTADDYDTLAQVTGSLFAYADSDNWEEARDCLLNTVSVDVRVSPPGDGDAFYSPKGLLYELHHRLVHLGDNERDKKNVTPEWEIVHEQINTEEDTQRKRFKDAIYKVFSDERPERSADYNGPWISPDRIKIPEDFGKAPIVVDFSVWGRNDSRVPEKWHLELDWSGDGAEPDCDDPVNIDAQAHVVKANVEEWWHTRNSGSVHPTQRGTRREY